MFNTVFFRSVIVAFSLGVFGCFGWPLLADGQEGAARNVRPDSFERPFLIEFQGPIDVALSRFMLTRIEKARQANADLIVLEIDSPGGLKSESLRIAKELRDIDWAYTVAFVPNEALSGAALVSLGCDEIIIDADATFGDIGEIYWDPESFAFRLAASKIESALVPKARNLAKSKGRPPEFAEAMIDKEVQVFRRPQGDGWEYKNVRVEEASPALPWELIPESGPDRFLTLTGDRMLELEFADANHGTQKELADRFGFDFKKMTTEKRLWSDRFADWLCSPWVTGLLIVVGFLALYLEMSAPGIGLGALVALACAALFFWSRFLGGTADWLEAILFLGGIVFLLMEVFVIPGWGISGVAGLIMMVAAVIMAGQDFVLPSNDREWAEFVTSTLVLLCSGVLALIGAGFITRKIGSIPVFNRLVLAPQTQNGSERASSSKPGEKPTPSTHPLVSVGDWGVAESLLRPAGRARFSDRSFDVISDGAYIPAGQQVRVVEIQGNRIVVVQVYED